jgi:cell wall-associated NlpC family hydrolase
MPRLAPLTLLVLALVFARVALADPAPAPAPGDAGEPATTMPVVPSPLPSPAPPPHAATPKAVPVGERAARYARHLLGVRYTYGGNSPATGFDCSGFVRYVWNHFGVELPRASYEQFDTGRRVPRGALRPGDLVFFDGAGHVGLYLGRGRFIHAPHTGTVVSIATLTGPYGVDYDGARRVS